MIVSKKKKKKKEVFSSNRYLRNTWGKSGKQGMTYFDVRFLKQYTNCREWHGLEVD